MSSDRLTAFSVCHRHALAFVAPQLADLMFAAVALMWLIPDRRVAAALNAR